MTTVTALKTLVLTSALFFLAACSGASDPGESTKPDLAQPGQLSSINNFADQQQSLFTGGQPSQEELAALADAGFQHVINLRPIQEQKQALQWDEAQLVQSLGMQYHAIPVSGAEAITIENATRLISLTDSLEGEPVFLHCASSNRVGALKALYEGAINKASTDEAVATGKRWGLASLEPVERARLAAPASTHPE